MQGVAIVILVKRRSTGEKQPAYYARHRHLWGSRDAKYEWLNQSEFGRETGWVEFQARPTYYLLVPKVVEIAVEYECSWKVTEVFGTGDQRSDSGKFYSLAIITHNDLLHVGWTYEEVFSRAATLADPNISDSSVLTTLPVSESPYWNTSREREKVRSSDWKSKILPVYYRPFDWRYIYYKTSVMK